MESSPASTLGADAPVSGREGAKSLIEEKTGLTFMLRALQHRNYRLFFAGQGISLIGTWLTTTATSWLVLSLARRGAVVEAATALGVVRFASQVPMSAFAPAAGVLVDRWNRHRVLVVTQFLSLVQSAALAYLTFRHTISIEHVVGLSVFQGLINAFDAPARQSFVVEIIDRREDLPNAIALNSSMFNGARLLGPALGGLLIAGVGEAWCFSIDAVSYIGVIAALLLMRLKPAPTRQRKHGAAHELLEGFRYALGFGPVRALLLLAGTISLTVASFQTLMPIFAERVASHAHAASVFGFLGASVGVGALCGAITLAARRTVIGLGRWIGLFAGLVGLSMMAFAWSQWLPFMLITSAIAGFGMIVVFASSNTMLQTIVEDEMRARLMSFFVVAVMGAAPLGGLIAGWVADRIGEPLTIVGSGVISLLAAGAFLFNLPALRAAVRPIYVRKGILPEVATGLAAADRVDTEVE